MDHRIFSSNIKVLKQEELGLPFKQLNDIQRFLRSVSGTGSGRHRTAPYTAPEPAPTDIDRNRHQPAQAGLDRTGPTPTGPARVVLWRIW